MNDQQLAELGAERLDETLAALERIKQAGAKREDVELLARELGVNQFMKTQQEKSHAQHQ